MQNDLRVLRVVLVPGVVQGLPCAGDSNGRNQAQTKARPPEDVGERPMVVAGRLERDLARRPERAEHADEPVDLCFGVSNPQTAALATW